MKKAIVLKDVSKSYEVFSDKGGILHSRHRSENKVALSDINITINVGEVVSIIGRNGSGKSTLMKIMAGILTPTDGTVEVNGKVMGIMETGMPFQLSLSGYENIFLRGMFYGLSKDQVKEVINDIIRFSELEEYIHVPMKMYSSGMRTRLAFAVLLYMDADIYVFDEALHTGDTQFSRKCSGYLRSLAKKGKTVVLCSHAQGIIKESSDRVILLDKGKVVVDGSCDDVLAEYRWGPYRDGDTLRFLADSGDPEAMYILAKTTVSDETERKTLIEKAAEKGLIPAMIAFADAEYDKDNRIISSEYYDAMSGDRNDVSMYRYALNRSGYTDMDLIEMFKDMAYVGDHFDKYRFAQIYRMLSAGKESSERAFRLYRKAYESGNLDAGYMLANLMLDGYGTDIDVDGAIKILTSLAEAGHSKSCALMARIYIDGRYVKRNDKELLKWCIAAAKIGDSLSQFRLSVMYHEGIGTKVDENESKKWAEIFIKNRMSSILLDAANSLEYSDHRFNLRDRDLYRIGMEGFSDRCTDYYLRTLFRSGSDRDRRMAFDVVKQYCMTSFNKEYLGRYYGDPDSPEFDELKSFSLTKIAADSGNSDAMFALANMYASGFGTEKDTIKAKRLMRSSARKRNPNAMVIIDKDRQVVKKCMKKISIASAGKRRDHIKSITKDD